MIMMKEKYCDLHTHTTLSDGVLNAEELIVEAIENNIGVLAITDHNRMMEENEFKRLREKYKDKIRLVRGAEVTCCHQIEDRKVELHSVVLLPDESYAEKFNKMILKRNTANSREPYIRAILTKLDEAGAGIGTYEDLQAMFPDKDYFGRPQVAEAMVMKGIVETCSQAFDIYIGEFGLKKAYVRNPNKDNYCTLQELVNVAIECKAIPILCHLYYYLLEESEERILLKDFAEMTHGIGGFETEYRIYDEEQRQRLRELRDEFGLFTSAASDYHKVFDTDGLDNQFSMEIFDNMINIWSEFYGKEILPV